MTIINLRNTDVLVLSRNSEICRSIRAALNLSGVVNVEITQMSIAALELLCAKKFDAIFVEDWEAMIDSKYFVTLARTTAGLRNPMISIFATLTAPTHGQIQKARQLGFTDVIAWPVSAAVVAKKLRTALSNPRSFIVDDEFVGHDRRSHQSAHSLSTERRKRKPRAIGVPDA